MTRCTRHPLFDGWQLPPSDCDECHLLHLDRHDKDITRNKPLFVDVERYFLMLEPV
jgi:hypothetical protein